MRHKRFRSVWFLVLVQFPSSVAAEVLEIQIPSQVSPNVAIALTQVAEEATVFANGGETLQQLVERACGLMPPIYYSVLGEANPSLRQGTGAVLAKDTQVILPACAPPPGAAPYTLAKGDMLSKFLAAATVPRGAIDQADTARSLTLLYDSALGQSVEVGATIDRSIFGSAQTAARLSNEMVLGTEAGAFVVGPPNGADGSLSSRPIPLTPVTDPNRVQEGATVLLPGQLPQPRTLVIRDGITFQEATAAIREAAALDGIISQGDIASRGQQLTLPQPMTGENRECLEEVVVNDWPLPWTAIATQLEINRQRSAGMSDASRILVLDTGFDFRGWMPGFPDEYFPRARALPVYTSPGVPSLSGPTVNGVNLATLRPGAETLDSSQDFRWHGTAVISAALGSRQDAEQPFGSRGIFPASAMSPFGAEPAALERAIKYAQDNDIEVLNYSFASTMQTDLHIKNRDVLLVVPAGNDGQTLGSVWPARYGGESDPLEYPVITVGGHEPSGAIWHASNRSRRFVDILAPSCSIPVYEGILKDGATEPVEAAVAGTSFAAPLVSFVAGFLAAEGLTPPEIKMRLNISARLHPDAIRWSYSGGLLNAPTALSLYSDVLVLRDSGGKTEAVQGRFSEEASVTAEVCGLEFYLPQLHKIATFSAPEGDKLRYWTSSESLAALWGVSIVRGEDDCLAEDFAFEATFVTDDGQSIPVSAGQIVDYTRRYSD